jgi:hypothetical protein
LEVDDHIAGRLQRLSVRWRTPGVGLGTQPSGSMAEHQLKDDPGGNGHQHEVITSSHPVVATRWRTEVVAPPVGHDVLGLVIEAGQASTTVEGVLRARTALRLALALRLLIVLLRRPLRAQLLLSLALCLGAPLIEVGRMLVGTSLVSRAIALLGLLVRLRIAVVAMASLLGMAHGR